jgi:hypothetical protein
MMSTPKIIAFGSLIGSSFMLHIDRAMGVSLKMQGGSGNNLSGFGQQQFQQPNPQQQMTQNNVHFSRILAQPQFSNKSQKYEENTSVHSSRNTGVFAQNSGGSTYSTPTYSIYANSIVSDLENYGEHQSNDHQSSIKFQSNHQSSIKDNKRKEKTFRKFGPQEERMLHQVQEVTNARKLEQRQMEKTAQEQREKTAQEQREKTAQEQWEKTAQELDKLIEEVQEEKKVGHSFNIGTSTADNFPKDAQGRANFMRNALGDDLKHQMQKNIANRKKLTREHIMGFRRQCQSYFNLKKPLFQGNVDKIAVL